MISNLNYESETTIGIDLDNFSIEEEIEKYSDQNFCELVNYNILVRQYISPSKTRSGLIIPEKTLQNEMYNSYVGLVVKKSPLAYDHPDFKNATGHWCEVGQWIIFSKNNAQSIFLFGNPCFFVNEKGVIARDLKDPRAVTQKFI